jgi:hypothetical protein
MFPVTCAKRAELTHNQLDATAQAIGKALNHWSNQVTVLGRLGEISVTGAPTSRAAMATRSSTALLICSAPFLIL